MKILKGVFVVLTGVLFMSHPVVAMKLAPFPNTKPLQPIPVNVLPNITNNINSDSAQAPAIQADLLDDSGTTSLTPETITQDSHTAAYIVYAVVGFAIVGAIFAKVKSKINE
jgi:hypothetical protein